MPVEKQVVEPVAAPTVSLWRHGDFLKLWSGQSASLIGTQTTLVALPLLAVTKLNASTAQMGLLAALGQLPYLLILFFGVWADRVRRRPLLITVDVTRGLIIALVPVMYLVGHVTIALLCGVTFAVGLLTTIFDVSWSAYLPTLVGRSRLAEANSRMQMSQSTAQAAGPGLVGLLLRWLPVAVVVFVDMASYLVSALLCLWIRNPEAKPRKDDTPSETVLAAIRAGLRCVWRDRYLRPMLLAETIFMIFGPAILALYYNFGYQVLHLPGSCIALILALSGPGAILGSAFGPRLIRRLGLGRMCLIAALGGNTSFLLIPLATRPEWFAVTILATAQFVFGFTMPLGMISTLTLRQAVTPNDMQGRVTATFNGLSFGLAPLGVVAAGFAAEVIGLRLTILIAAIGVLIPIVILFVSPLLRVRDIPDLAEASAALAD